LTSLEDATGKKDTDVFALVKHPGQAVGMANNGRLSPID
jgi:hypothetical protein